MNSETDPPEAAEDQAPGTQESPPDLLERVVSWISAALVLALAGFFVWESLQQKSPPGIAVQAETPWQREGTYYLPVDVQNTGDLSVQNLRIQGRLMDGRQVVETTEAKVSWLPAHSTRRVVLAFERDVRTYDLQVRPEGYEQP